jgi:hypothetical protein
MIQELGIPDRGEMARQGRDRRSGFGLQIVEYVQDHRDEWLAQILESLSEEHRSKFDDMPPRTQRQQLARWFAQRRGRGNGPPFLDITQQELEQFFVNETSPADKERLLALPRAQMEQELRRRYLRSALGEDFAPEPGPFGPRGGRGGPGPGRGFGRPGDREGFEPRPFEGPPPEGFRPPPPRPEDEF